MYLEKREGKNGITYVVVERYRDPITGKSKRASVSFKQNTIRARRQAERELLEKIEAIFEEKESPYQGEKFTQFGQLKESWFQTWTTTVKPQTINRELLVLRRLSDMIPDETLLSKITPLFVQHCLTEYREKYRASHSTLQHIKSTLNKIFDYGVLHNAIMFSPSKVIKLNASIVDKQAKRKRREDKFLTDREVNVLLSELKGRRNKTYYDLAIFLLGTGCRIGEASGLTYDDIDFEHKRVTISKSLHSNDLRVEEYYLDTTKTVAGERTIYLPDVVIEALLRVIERNRRFEEYVKKHPSKAFWKNDFLFKTEYGSPITSHSFRGILMRVNQQLRKKCKARYGFDWTKNVVPHSFRHIHITALRNSSNVPLKEIQERVGHVELETTNGYTHLVDNGQDKSVQTITDFIQKVDVAQNLPKNQKIM